MVGLGAAELGVIALLLFGGAGVMPQAGVPLPPDAGLQSAAPPECLLYLASNGIGKPDPKSTNQIEQLLAEEEVQAFVGEVVRLAYEGLKQVPARSEQEQTLARNLPIVARALLTRPITAYLATVDLPPNAPGGHAALIVHAGEQAAELVEALEELEKLYMTQIPPNMSVEKSETAEGRLRKLPTPPQVPPVVWGVQGSYVFLAIGEGEAATVSKRLAAKGEPPAWLTDFQKQTDIPRPGTTFYLNLAGALKTVDPLIDQLAAVTPFNVRKVLDALGLQHLKYAVLASGLDEIGTVSKLVVAHDGEATGVLKLLQGKPLAVDQLRRIPKAVDFATVNRFDAAGLFDAVLKIAEQIEPRTGEQATAALGQVEEQLGFSVRRDLLDGLGDTLTVYNSAPEGGLIFTGLCATIGVRDRSKVEKVIDRVQRLAEAQRSAERPEFAIRKTTVANRTIWYVQFLREPVPLAPAWCLTDDELVVAITPQMVRAHLTRTADAGSLADVKSVADALSTGDVTAVAYSDPKLSYELLYSYLNYGAVAGASALEKETGIRADLTKLPSYVTVSRHMRPSLGLSRSTNNAWILESHATGPAISPASIGVIGIGAALVLPAVQSARTAARTAVSQNNLRQLTLAVINYSDVNAGKFPPRAIQSADGKPLLSWRVAILPYIDQEALYRQFHLDEPWDSEHNRTLIAAMPQIFLHPQISVDQPGTTLYQIPAGSNTFFGGDEPPTMNRLIQSDRGVSGIALLVEAARSEAVVWTKPADVELDADNPLLAKLLFGPDGRVNVAMCDGSVRRISTLDAAEDLRSLFFSKLPTK